MVNDLLLLVKRTRYPHYYQAMSSSVLPIAPTMPHPPLRLMAPIRSLLGHLVQSGDRPAIASYIALANAPEVDGVIEESVGSFVTFTPDVTTLAMLQVPSHIRRLDAMH